MPTIHSTRNSKASSLILKCYLTPTDNSLTVQNKLLLLFTVFYYICYIFRFVRNNTRFQILCQVFFNYIICLITTNTIIKSNDGNIFNTLIFFISRILRPNAISNNPPVALNSTIIGSLAPVTN